jgi:4-amino-4-deoxy-L-arabinose transferase-like glycosyltransferase
MREFPRRNAAIAVILAVFVAMACIFSLVTPLFESYDEPLHFAVVRNIALGRGLPEVMPGQATPWQQEAGQPPLYYLAAAPLVSWIDMSDLEELLVANPFYPYFRGPPNDNHNGWLHTNAEAFPFTGAALAVHLIRLLSVFLGAITVAFSFKIAQLVFPGESALAVAAASMVAFNPKFVYLSGAITNDSLLAAACTVGVYLLMRTVRDGATWRRLWLLGLVLALTALTKLSGLALYALAILALAYLAWQRRSWRPLLHGGFALALTALLIAGWWYARNWTLYGDPTGMQAFLRSVPVGDSGMRASPASPRVILTDLQPVELSYWAIFGAGQVLADEVAYDGLKLLVRLALVGLGIFLWRQRGKLRAPDTALVLLGLLAAWLLGIFAAMVQYMRIIVSRDGRLLFPAIAAIGILLTLGLAQWAPRRFRWALPLLAGAALLVLTVISPFRYVAPAFARPPILASVNESLIRNPLRIHFGEVAELIGYDLAAERVRPGDELKLTAYWRSLAPTSKDYAVFVHLRGEDGRLLGQRDTYTGLGNYPTSLWRPGQIIADSYWVPVLDTISAALPGESPVGRIDLGLYSLETKLLLPAVDSLGQPVGPTIGRFKLVAPAQPAPAAPNTTRTVLGDQVALLGFDLSQEPATRGQPVRVGLWWSALAPVSRDYTVFLHLTDATGKPLAQTDGPPLGGSYPTSWWDKGEVIWEERVLVLPADVAPGAYAVLAGLYDLKTGIRLAAGAGDAIRLGEVRVE